MAELPQWAKHTFRVDFCADCTLFCGDTPLFAPANADPQNAREITMLAHQIDQPHNPSGRVVIVISRMCAFSRGGTSKKIRKNCPVLQYFPISALQVSIA
jgi:hypothetical protein